MSSSLLLHQCSTYQVRLTLFVRREVSGCKATVSWGVASRISFKQHVAFLYSSYLAFLHMFL